MRQLFLSVFVLLLSATAAFGQSEADLKSAKKAFSSFQINSDNAKLTEAVDNINKVMADAAMQKNPEALVMAGDIYSAAINSYINTRSINLENPAETPQLVEGAAAKAADAYLTAYELADPKKGKKQRKAAIKGLKALQGNLSNEGIYAIQDKRFADSETSFVTSVKVHNFLKEQGEDSALDDETKLNDEKYYAGLSAILNDDFATAEPLYNELYAAQFDEAAIFDGLYKIAMSKEDKAAAEKYLTEGREKYPENTQLLFTEINFLLTDGRLNELTTKLDQAIEKEPENVSLYATLGQVYERLYNKATEEGAEEDASKYYALAREKYEAGLKVDPEAGRLIYSLGAMIYNRGAIMSQQLEELGNDFSKEGQKKYEELKTLVDTKFAQALPYFQKAEMADPNDLNTLIALKEMYARNEDFATSGEFKTRIERVQAGEKIEKSYFKEKGM